MPWPGYRKESVMCGGCGWLEPDGEPGDPCPECAMTMDYAKVNIPGFFKSKDNGDSVCLCTDCRTIHDNPRAHEGATCVCGGTLQRYIRD